MGSGVGYPKTIRLHFELSKVYAIALESIRSPLGAIVDADKVQGDAVSRSILQRVA